VGRLDLGTVAARAADIVAIAADIVDSVVTRMLLSLQHWGQTWLVCCRPEAKAVSCPDS
jgi:hypothetical protein